MHFKVETSAALLQWPKQHLRKNIHKASGMDIDPPFYETYKTLIDNAFQHQSNKINGNGTTDMVEEWELPTIDISSLNLDDDTETAKKEYCNEEIAKASRERGFFQVVNHGVSGEILEKMRCEQVKVFKQPFERKSKEMDKLLSFSQGTYRWGTPSATCLKQVLWSEAFHVPMTDILAPSTTPSTLSSTAEQFGTTVASLAQTLADSLAVKLGRDSSFFKENCLPSTCYLRLNRYPPCPIPSEVYGLMPHTDSDFLTILYQDQVGGLQLVKDGKWFAVKPNPEALIIGIGDLFQAWSNDVYKSVEHRVVTNPRAERFSTAYFFCPSYDAEICSSDNLNHDSSSLYKKFSFREYRQQVQDDVQNLGYKVGLSRFLL